MRTNKRKENVCEAQVPSKQDKKDEVDILLQETWDESDFVKDVGEGYTLFHHNSKAKKDRTGVALILSPGMTKAWKDAGGIDPIQTKKGGTLKDDS